MTTRALHRYEPESWPSWVTPGWYVAAPSSELRREQVTSLTIAGRPLAMARTQSGRPVIVDRYCAHQGASLAAGQIVGETLQCPFHHWRYDRLGACVEIPACSKIPPRAAVASHPVEDRFGFVWIFVGSPAAARLRPLETAHELAGDEGWRSVGTRRMGTVSTTPRDMVENVVDHSHFSCVHGVHGPPRKLDFSFDADRFRADWTVPLLGRELVGRTVVYPPGLWFTTLRGFSRLGLPFDAATWLFSTQPEAPESTRCFASVLVEGRRRWPTDRLFERLIIEFFAYGFRQDIRIWKDKVVRERPVLCATDTGPVIPYRRWWFDSTSRAGAECEPSEEAAQ